MSALLPLKEFLAVHTRVPGFPAVAPPPRSGLRARLTRPAETLAVLSGAIVLAAERVGCR